MVRFFFPADLFLSSVFSSVSLWPLLRLLSSLASTSLPNIAVKVKQRVKQVFDWIFLVLSGPFLVLIWSIFGLYLVLLWYFNLVLTWSLYLMLIWYLFGPIQFLFASYWVLIGVFIWSLFSPYLILILKIKLMLDPLIVQWCTLTHSMASRNLSISSSEPSLGLCTASLP